MAGRPSGQTMGPTPTTGQVTAPDEGSPTTADLVTADFIHAFADHWVRGGGQRTEGRVLAHLLVTTARQVSSAELMAVLPASAGAVSTATRSLVAAGYVVRHQRPGDRSYYFSVPDDVWGSRLLTGRGWAERAGSLLERLLATLPADDARAARLRLGCDFLAWQAGHHDRMVADWQARCAARAQARQSG